MQPEQIIIDVMKNSHIWEIFGATAKNDSGGAAKNASRVQTAALALLLSSVATLSGCIGLTSAQVQANQSKTSTLAPLMVSPNTVNFGTVAIGGTVSQSVTVSNPNASSISVTQASTTTGGLTISGATLPMTLAAGQQSTVNIVFSPKTSGNISGNVAVMSSASSSPSMVAVSATAVAAQSLLNASSASLSFGSVAAGATSVHSITLWNAGNSNITISSVSFSGTQYSETGVTSGMILAPGQSATLDLNYSPTAIGTSNGSVTVVSSATNSPAVIKLSGTGAAASSHSVALAWAPDPTAVAGYNVYRANVSGGPYSKVTSPDVATTSFTDTSVQNGFTYYYVVTALTASGMESSPSTEVSAAIPAI